MCKLISQYDGPELQNKKTLEFCSISEGTRLPVFHLPWAARTLFFKTLTGKTVECEFETSETILSLKTRLENMEGIPRGTPPSLTSIHRLIAIVVDMPGLVFSGQMLNDSRVVSDYNIQRGSTIHVVLRLRGGGGWEALAYAIVYHGWDGDMASRFLQGYIIEETRIPPSFPLSRGSSLFAERLSSLLGW